VNDVESVVLPPERTACPLARTWARERLAPLEMDAALVEDLVLCIDELVANVVIHTTSSPMLTVAIGDGIRIEVADSDGDVAASLRQADDGRPGGFGLRIVDRVADRWGSAAKPSGGKVVWLWVEPERVRSGS
jgi:anti-sigma regulatory factor (Ser/Thr protein kinase)